MKRKFEDEPAGRPSVVGQLRKVVPDLYPCPVCRNRRPRAWIDGMEYELTEDGEWEAVED